MQNVDLGYDNGIWESLKKAPYLTAILNMQVELK